MTRAHPTPSPDSCSLQHPGFALLAAGRFRRAVGDAEPAMVIEMGDREAVLPLTALRRAFDIADDSPDGRMLALIAESLDYVCELKQGDALPGEVVSGDASWAPEPVHRTMAAARVRKQLAALVGQADPRAGDEGARQQLQTAFDAAARALGLPSAQQAVDLVAQIAEEQAYVEALRADLLGPVRRLAAELDSARTDALLGQWRGDDRRMETLRQVRRLSRVAALEMVELFAELDERNGDIMAALANVDAHRAFIRSTRDSLHRRRRAWEPILRQWSGEQSLTDRAVWQRLDALYRFLAPRYMPVMQWTKAAANAGPSRATRRAKLPANAIAWPLGASG